MDKAGMVVSFQFKVLIFLSTSVTCRSVFGLLGITRSHFINQASTVASTTLAQRHQGDSSEATCSHLSTKVLLASNEIPVSVWSPIKRADRSPLHSPASYFHRISLSKIVRLLVGVDLPFDIAREFPLERSKVVSIGHLSYVFLLVLVSNNAHCS